MVDWAIAATLESMCSSPQATSQNGAAALRTPSTTQARQDARIPVTAGPAPIVLQR